VVAVSENKQASDVHGAQYTCIENMARSIDTDNIDMLRLVLADIADFAARAKDFTPELAVQVGKNANAQLKPGREFLNDVQYLYESRKVSSGFLRQLQVTDNWKSELGGQTNDPIGEGASKRRKMRE